MPFVCSLLAHVFLLRGVFRLALPIASAIGVPKASRCLQGVLVHSQHELLKAVHPQTPWLDTIIRLSRASYQGDFVIDTKEKVHIR